MVEGQDTAVSDTELENENQSDDAEAPQGGKGKKKTCCGKKICTCNIKKTEIQPCEQHTQSISINRKCVCGRPNCECYGTKTLKSPDRPKFVDVYKCSYPGDEVKQVCVCGDSDCTCHSQKRKNRISTYESIVKRRSECENHVLEKRPPCICGKPYCYCRKAIPPTTNVPEIEFVYFEQCDVHVAPVKNFCICGKPDCTCFKENKIVDDDKECSYRVPLVRPLCVCRKVDCTCNIDRAGEKKIPKKIEVSQAPAPCICGKIFCACNIGRAVDPEEEQLKIADKEKIKIELEKSNYVKEREMLLRTFEVPSLTDAKKTLGDIAGFVYEQCEAGLRMHIPTIPEMSYGDLWVSPSDLLIPHVGLKAPLTRKHLQALTHEGILEIGHHIELSFLNQMEMEKEDALESQKQELTNQFQSNIKQLMKDVEAKERAACQRELKRITEEFEQKLKDEIKAMELKLQHEYEEFTQNHDLKINQMWELKLKQTVEETTKNITKQFLEELSKQEQILSLHFKTELTKRELQRLYELSKRDHEHSQLVQRTKYRLHCTSIANMMYILCMERRKCIDEKTSIELYYKNKIDRLKKTIGKQKDDVKDLKQEVQNQLKEVDLRETCILEILKQYQKFINFALKAAPTQAEFLLSIEKLLIFELTDTLKNLQGQSKGESRPCSNILPWRHMTPSEEAVNILEDDNRLDVIDYHECLNELPIPKKKEDMVLPAFIFNKKLYVREDFRNMMSHGIKPSPSHDLWSDDVDALMETLKQSVSEEDFKSEWMSSSTDMQKKNIKDADRSSVAQIKFDSNESHLTDVAKPSYVNEEGPSVKERVDSKSPLKYTSVVLNPIDHSKVGSVEATPNLLGIQSSLELMIKKNVSFRTKPDAGWNGPAEMIPEEEHEEEEETIDDINDINLVIKKVSSQFISIEKLSVTSTGVSNTKERKVDLSKNRIYPQSKPAEPIRYVNSTESIKQVDTKVPPKSDALLTTHLRDSVILRTSSFAKERKKFSLSPVNSIDVKKESSINSLLRKKSSRLMTAKDSLSLLKESRSLLREPTVCQVCPKKDGTKDNTSKEMVPRECEKCLKQKDSLEVVNDGVLPKKSKMDELKQLRLSHVEIISVKENNLKSNVSFQTEPITIDNDFEITTERLSNMYKQPKKKVKDKKKKPYDPCKNKFVYTAHISGERGGTEHLQDNEEFTVDRMRSFISIIGEHPNLIKMFTACQR